MADPYGEIAYALEVEGKLGANAMKRVAAGARSPDMHWCINIGWTPCTYAPDVDLATCITYEDEKTQKEGRARDDKICR